MRTTPIQNAPSVVARVALTVALALPLVGCFGRRDAAPGPDVDFGEPDRSYGISKRGDARAMPEASTLEQRALLTVPPDRALVRIDIAMRADSYAAARKDVGDVAKDLVERIAAVEGCEARIEESSTPRAQGREQWLGRSVLRLDAALTDRASLEDRTARVDACVEPLHALREAGGETMDRAEISVGEPWYTVDRPGQHRTALLQAALVPLEEVAALEGTPPQFDARLTRCTSSGHVSITQRSASGVGLTVDFTCDTTLDTPAASPGPVGIAQPSAGSGGTSGPP